MFENEVHKCTVLCETKRFVTNKCFNLLTTIYTYIGSLQLTSQHERRYFTANIHKILQKDVPRTCLGPIIPTPSDLHNTSSI